MDAEEVAIEWLDEFSPTAYAPMARLLEKNDVDYLATQPGYNPGIGKRLMSERRKIFASYLEYLVQDFNRLMDIGKLMVVFSPQDSDEFARQLFQRQVRFYGRVCLARLQLALYPLGWAIDSRALIAALGAVRDQVRALATPRVAHFEIG